MIESAAQASTESRVECHRLLQEARGLPQRREVTSSNARAFRYSWYAATLAVGRLVSLLLLAAGQCHAQRARHPGRDLRLHLEHVGDVVVERSAATSRCRCGRRSAPAPPAPGASRSRSRPSAPCPPAGSRRPVPSAISVRRFALPLYSDVLDDAMISSPFTRDSLPRTSSAMPSAKYSSVAGALVLERQHRDPVATGRAPPYPPSPPSPPCHHRGTDRHRHAAPRHPRSPGCAVRTASSASRPPPPTPPSSSPAPLRSPRRRDRRRRARRHLPTCRMPSIAVMSASPVAIPIDRVLGQRLLHHARPSPPAVPAAPRSASAAPR